MKHLTGFQRKVFEVVQKIPKGSFLTYKKVAEEAGFPWAWRAVGNPKIPCHRVIRSNGKIGGYNKGVKKKMSLLLEENVVTKR